MGKSRVGAVILAAGEGSRIGAGEINKVMLPVGGKPILAHTVEHLDQAGIEPILLVVGYAKDSVVSYFAGRVLYAEQEEQLGTAHAAAAGLAKLPEEVEAVLVTYGDDSYNYPADLFRRMVERHRKAQGVITFLTLTPDDPTGLGRVLRDGRGEVKAIVEEKDATPQERRIGEINAGCYIFQRDFLEQYLPRVSPSPVTGEYYLTDLIGFAVKDGQNLETIRGGNLPWQGINTTADLAAARRLCGDDLV